jgi:hypothetical protein
MFLHLSKKFACSELASMAVRQNLGHKSYHRVRLLLNPQPIPCRQPKNHIISERPTVDKRIMGSAGITTYKLTSETGRRVVIYSGEVRDPDCIYHQPATRRQLKPQLFSLDCFCWHLARFQLLTCGTVYVQFDLLEAKNTSARMVDFKGPRNWISQEVTGLHYRYPEYSERSAYIHLAALIGWFSAAMCLPPGCCLGLVRFWY